MKKINIIKNKEDFNNIIKTKKPYVYKDYILYVNFNNQELEYKFGISVGTKIGNAVTRNKIKRQIKNILDKYTYQNNIKCIIIVRKSILNKTFHEKSTILIEALNNLKLIKGEKHEKK